MRISKEFKRRSCLNEEYTKMIEEIDMHLREAEVLFCQLPSAVKDNGLELIDGIDNAIHEVEAFERSYGIIE